MKKTINSERRRKEKFYDDNDDVLLIENFVLKRFEKRYLRRTCASSVQYVESRNLNSVNSRRNRQSIIIRSNDLTSFPSVHLDDLVLIDVLEDVWRIDENADGAGCRDGEEHVQLQAINHHSHVFPIFTNLQQKSSREGINQ